MGKNKGKNPKSKVTFSRMKIPADETPHEPVVVNRLVLWFDASVTINAPEYEQTIEKLRKVVPFVGFFDEIENCLRFIQLLHVEIFVLVGGSVREDHLGQLHSLEQVRCIYVYRGNPQQYSAGSRKWPKIQGKYDRVEAICQQLEQTSKAPRSPSTSIVFLSSESDEPVEHFNHLEPSFMYTELLKNILLRIDYREVSKEEFINCCKQRYETNPRELKMIDEFCREYRSSDAISWYTRDTFLVRMLNRALRMFDAQIILQIGFFIRDLHEHINRLHLEQLNRNLLTVYRGQRLCEKEFRRLQKHDGVLLSFNHFLSTSVNREVSRVFADYNSHDLNTVGIIFRIEIDPEVNSTPFAHISDLSVFREEQEVLFSMNTIFRVTNIRELDEGNQFFEVALSLTKDDDPDLRAVMNRIEEELGDGNPWERLGHLLIKMGQVDQAEKLYKDLLRQSPAESDTAIYYHHLGVIKDQQRSWKEAIEYYEKTLQIEEKNPEANKLNRAMALNNIGSCYEKMKRFDNALRYYREAVDIRRTFLPDNHPDLAQSYNNIGAVFYHQKQYDEAHLYYGRSLEIKEKTLPTCHPSLATAYNNLASIYFDTVRYEEAIKHFHRALHIRLKSLPENHPDIAQTLSNLGTVHAKMGDHSRALIYHERALRIQQSIFSSHQPLISTSYRNIGIALMHLQRYAEALRNFHRALEIQSQLVPPTHPTMKTLLELIDTGEKKRQSESHLPKSSFKEKKRVETKI